MIGEANFVQLGCRFTMKSLSRQHLTFDMFNSRIRWVIPNFLIGSYKEEIICQHCKTLRNVLKCHAISQITRYVLLLSYDWIITRLGFLSKGLIVKYKHDNITLFSKCTLLVLTISLIDIWHRNKQSTFFSSKTIRLR